MNSFPLFLDQQGIMETATAQALEDCLSSWNDHGKPVALNFRVQPKSEEPLMRASLRFLVHDDAETTSWMTPREIGIEDYLPLSAATILLSTDRVFDEAIVRISTGMASDRIDILVIGGAALFISPVKFVTDYVPPTWADQTISDNLVRLGINSAQSSHERLSRISGFAPLIEFANSHHTGALTGKNWFEVEMSGPMISS